MDSKITLKDGAANKLVWVILLMFYGGVFTGGAGIRRDLKGWDTETYTSFFIGIGLVLISGIILFSLLKNLSTRDIETENKEAK